MKKLKSLFAFNKQERRGIFFLLLLIGVLQILYFLLSRDSFSRQNSSFYIDHQLEQEIDSLKALASSRKERVAYQFNPNFIDDYKGYRLGMSITEIDRLLEFRASGRFIRSAEEFQKITGISDSLMKTISPNFKFPDWYKTPKQKQRASGGVVVSKAPIAVQDLNKVGASDLKSVYGVGSVLSQRIVKFRGSLGGFLANEQLYDVYGLKPEVVERILRRFTVIEIPKIEKINVNTASVGELSAFTYFNRTLARAIVDYRETQGDIGSYNELEAITGFPKDKIARIELYLCF